MQLINLTPHAINIITSSGTLTIQPSGVVARVETELHGSRQLEVDGHSIEISTRKLGKVANLLSAMDDTLYIVSTMVADAAAYRDDLVVPGELVRDSAGVIIGCRGLYRSAGNMLG